MAQDSMMKLEVNVPVMADGVVSVPQFGMRYPDGSVKWGSAVVSTVDLPFSKLADGDTYDWSTADKWDKHLDSCAGYAKLDVDAYKAGHQLIRRTVIVGTTKHENAKARPMQKPASNSAW